MRHLLLEFRIGAVVCVAAPSDDLYPVFGEVTHERRLQTIQELEVEYYSHHFSAYTVFKNSKYSLICVSHLALHQVYHTYFHGHSCYIVHLVIMSNFVHSSSFEQWVFCCEFVSPTVHNHVHVYINLKSLCCCIYYYWWTQYNGVHYQCNMYLCTHMYMYMLPSSPWLQINLSGGITLCKGQKLMIVSMFVVSSYYTKLCWAKVTRGTKYSSVVCRYVCRNDTNVC